MHRIGFAGQASGGAGAELVRDELLALERRIEIVEEASG